MDVYLLRQRLGMNQQQFAEHIGTRQATISDWETGTKAPSPMARRLLDLLMEKTDRDEREAKQASAAPKRSAPRAKRAAVAGPPAITPTKKAATKRRAKE